MHILLTALLTVISSSVFAATSHCEKYSHKTRYIEAIRAVAQHENMAYEELCALPKVLDIEAQPSRVVTVQGEVIPHVQVQLHMAQQSCLYMVRDADLAITSNRCYSGW